MTALGVLLNCAQSAILALERVLARPQKSLTFSKISVTLVSLEPMICWFRSADVTARPTHISWRFLAEHIVTYRNYIRHAVQALHDIPHVTIRSAWNREMWAGLAVMSALLNQRIMGSMLIRVTLILLNVKVIKQLLKCYYNTSSAVTIRAPKN